MKTTILENNIIQTTGSAGESIAAGVVFTLPGFLFLSESGSANFFNYFTILILAIFGGILGTLMMIPLRRAFVVKQHGILAYPEGTACADVLIVGEKGGTSAKTVFLGFGVGFVYWFLAEGFHLFKTIPLKAMNFFKGATVSAEIAPHSVGVGYIIGTRISCIMVVGGVLASWVLAQAIVFFGS